MKHTLALVLMVFGVVGCATSPPDPSKDFKATAAAPNLDQFIDEGNCWAGCKSNKVFSCDSMATLTEAKSCAINKCETHYQYLTDSPFWKGKKYNRAICIAEDTSSYSVIEERHLSYQPDTVFRYRFALCDGSNKCVKMIENFDNAYRKASDANRTLYLGPKHQAKFREAEANQRAYLVAFNKELKAKEARQKRLNEAKKQKAEAERKKLQAQQEEFMTYIETLKNNCKTYGFTADNAIATCVQREINLERDRIQAQQIAKQNQPIIQQVQPSYRNSGPNWDALGSMGSCLQTEGSFAACSNAWQGYTPPKKTVTKCRYDTFGNVITGTCTTQ